DDVRDRQRRVRERRVDAELLVRLVAADLREVVALGVEVEVLEQRAAGLDGRRLARADLAVQVDERLVLRVDVVLLERVEHRREVRELLADLRLGQAERLEQHGDRLLALAVDAHADGVALVDLELEPGAARRDDLRGEDVLVARLVRRALEVDARRADELRDDDALGAVDDERAALGHEREVAHEDRLALDLTGVVVDELRGDEERRGVREVLLLALVGRVLRRLEQVVGERQGHRGPEVLDRGGLLEDLLEARRRGHVLAAGLGRGGDARLPRLVAEQPVEALGLEAQQVGDLEGLEDLGEGEATRRGAVRDGVGGRSRRGARGSQEGSFPADRKNAAPPGWTRSPPPRHLADAHVRRRGGRGYMRSGAQDSAKREHTPDTRRDTTPGARHPTRPGAGAALPVLPRASSPACGPTTDRDPAGVDLAVLRRRPAHGGTLVAVP